MSWWSTTRLIAKRDLLVEWRSRIALNQVYPFAGIVMVMFGFAIDNTSLMERIAPGLVVLATMFSLLVLVQRSFAVETEDGALDALRTAGVSSTALFWGKSIALAVQLAVLEAILVLLAVLLYGSTIRPSGVILLLLTWVAAPGVWRPLVRSTAASQLARGGGRPFSRCSCCQSWRQF